MALQGNPFLGKLKIPAPDLSRIPSAPFEAQTTELSGHSKLVEEPKTKWQQTDNKPITKPATNRKQSGNKLETHSSPRKETGNKVGTQPATLSATKWQQTDNKPITNIHFSSLVGLQRAIMIFLYEACKTARGRSTDALTLEHIGSYVNSSSGSVKTTIQRLEYKRCISRIEFKNGRGGWSKYEIPEAIFREMLQLETETKVATNRKQSGNKVGTQPATEPATSLSSSSSILELENLKTTTDDPELFENTQTQLSPEWLAVDFSPLSEIGFTQTHLVQIIKQGKLSVEEVQDSIYYYSFDLNRNGKGKFLNGSPLNFIMGILRKGIPYTPPANYESPAEEARRKTREFKERREHELKAEEMKLMDLEFSEWKRGLALENLVHLLPDFARKPGPIQDSALKSHFETHIWPERSQEVLGLVRIDRIEIAREIEQSLGEKKG